MVPEIRGMVRTSRASYASSQHSAKIERHGRSQRQVAG